MVKRHHTGSGRRAVIPKAWEPTHATVVEGALRGRVSIRRSGFSGEEWSDAEDAYVGVPLAPYATNVPARVQRLSAQTRDVIAADDDETIVDHLVVIPWDMAEVETGHLVTITETTDDQLRDVVLRVHTVGLGTERFERDLFCTLT